MLKTNSQYQETGLKAVVYPYPVKAATHAIFGKDQKLHRFVLLFAE